MSDERFRRELNQVFDDVAGPTSSNLHDRVHSAVLSASDTRGPYWIAAVAAAIVAVLLVGALLVSGPLRGSQAPVGQPHATPSPVATPSQLSSPSPFLCQGPDSLVKPTAGGGATPPVAYVSAVGIEGHGSYDRLTIEFANGVPQDAQVSNLSSGTTFTLSPSGMTAALKGDRGILITIHGADLHTAYTGSTDKVTGDPTIAEVRRVQDFEGVVQIGLGVKGAGCYHAYWLSGPDRLVIDVQAA